jgi:CarboxypepD_reg-like domain
MCFKNMYISIMNHAIKAIQLNKPCHENWDNMTDIAGGKFCAGCQKNVVDFSKLSNQQILDHLTRSGNLCGRFDKMQFDNLNLYLSANNKKPSLFRNWAFAVVLLSLLPFTNADAKIKQGYEQRETSFKKMPLIDTTKYTTITGIVTDSILSAMPGTTIRVKGTNIKAVTDANGRFKLYVPDTAVLEFSFIGYYSKELLINAGQNENYNIVLSENKELKNVNAWVGEVIIYKRPFSRLWRRIKTQKEN